MEKWSWMISLGPIASLLAGVGQEGQVERSCCAIGFSDRGGRREPKDAGTVWKLGRERRGIPYNPPQELLKGISRYVPIVNL